MLDPLVLLALGLSRLLSHRAGDLGGFSGFLLPPHTVSAWNEALAEVARRLQLPAPVGHRLRPAALEGRIGSLTIRITLHVSTAAVLVGGGRGERRASSRLAVVHDHDPGLSLGSEDALAALGRLAQREVVLGHPHLDDLVSIRGDEPTARALLDHDTRQRVLDAVISRAGLSGGTWVLDHGILITDPVRLMGDLQTLLTAARALDARRGRIPERLAEVAMGDPRLEVRQRALATLVERFGDLPATRDAVRHTLVEAGCAQPLTLEEVAATLSRLDGVALAAAWWLRRHGTTRAVPALKAARQLGGRRVSRAADQAIATLQAAVHPDAAGSLHLSAQDERGALSQASDAQGRISPPGDDPA